MIVIQEAYILIMTICHICFFVRTNMCESTFYTFILFVFVPLE